MQVLLDSEGIDAWDQVRMRNLDLLVLHAFALLHTARVADCSRLADCTVQHSDFLSGCAAVKPICLQPDGWH